MPPLKHYTHRISDSVILDKMISVAKELSPDLQQTQLTLEIDPQRSINVGISGQEKNPEIQLIRKINSTVLQRVTLNIPNHPWQGSIRYERNGTSASFEININNNCPLKDFLRAFAICNKEFPTYERTEALDKLLGDELSEFYRKRESALVRLEDLSQEIIERNEEYRRQVDAEHQNAEQRLREKYANESKILHDEHEQQLEAVRKREKAVEERTKDLDDRSSRHARRHIREALKQEIKDRSTEFSLTENTRKKRWIIHVLFVFSILFLLAMTVLSTLSVEGKTGAEMWFFLGKLAAASVGMIATLIYYIRWNNHWFNRHAEEEFAVKRFELDFDRASWLVEMALEWKEEEQRNIPPEILTALTANLFGRDNGEKEPRHPYEDIVSKIMEASADMSLELPGLGKVRIDRKGRRGLEKALHED